MVGIFTFAQFRKEVSSETKQIVDVNIKEFYQQNGIDQKKVSLINFWATWCLPCMKELPSLNRLFELKKNEDFQVIGINSDYENQKKLVDKTIKELKVSFPQVLDKEGKLVEKFNVSGLPTTLVIHNDKVVRVLAGEHDFDAQEFLKFINKLLAK